VYLGCKDFISNLVGLGFEPMLVTFFYQLSVPDGGGGGGTMWQRRRGWQALVEEAQGWRAHVAEGGRLGWGLPPCWLD
jgi:hypothetical protein